MGGGEEASLFDLLLKLRARLPLLVALPVAAAVAIPSICAFLPPRYGCACLVQMAQLTQVLPARNVAVESPASAREWLEFRYLENRAARDVGPFVKRAGISTSPSLLDFEAWGASPEAARAACQEVLAELQKTFQPRLESHVASQKKVIADLEEQAAHYQALLSRAANGGPPSVSPELQAVVSMEVDKLRADLAALRSQIEGLRLAIDPAQSFNFTAVAIRPVSSGPVYPRPWAMTAVGAAAALALAVLIALFLDGLREAGRRRSGAPPVPPG